MSRFLLALALLSAIAPGAFAFDHEYENYGLVLGSYVKEGLVDYAALQKDRKGVDDFLKEAAVVSESEYKSWTRDQQLAFWINVYNAWLLQIVIDHYPIQRGGLKGIIFPANSIQQISGIWDEIKIQAAGQEVTLNSIEHKILRPVFKEPRIHFSIVCASMGCPKLRSEPYRASILSEQLDDSARAFINDETKVRLKTERTEIFISKIFDWFPEDFSSAADDAWNQKYGKDQAGPIAFIAGFLPEKDSHFLKSQRVNVEYLDYDWTLNEQKSSGAQASSLH